MLPMIRMVGTLLALGLLLALGQVSEIVSAIAGASIVLAATGIALTFVAFGVSTLKWQRLLASRNIVVGFGRLYSLNMLAQLYSLVLPGQLAGEAVKTIRVIHEAERRSVLVASVALDRITGLAGLLIIGLAGWAAVGASREPAAGAVLGVALVVLLVASWLLASGADKKASQAVGMFSRVASATGRFRCAWREYRDDSAALLEALCLSIVFQGLLAFSTWVFTRALGLEISVWDVAWVFAFVSVAQILPISMAGVGTRDGALVGLLAGFEVSQANALALSFLILMSFLAQGLVGAVVDILGLTRTEQGDDAHVNRESDGPSGTGIP